MTSHFLHAEWNNLIMANYAVPKELLLPFLPYKTELDFYGEETYVSLVGFMFLNTRIKGFSVPYHINFEEVNLRFYVRHNSGGTWKRGTVFLKEIVPKAAISFIANSLFREKYVTMKMKHFHVEKPDEIETCYEWKYKEKWNKISAICHKKSMAMSVGSEEEFIAEHYWGYSKYNNTKTFEYEVQHPRWEIFRVSDYEINCDFNAIYGNEFKFLKDAKPRSVFMAKGSEVKIFYKKTLS
ncbi:MAG: DUF2071 domain-containing protein [Bacteroidota bacterium]|nr:DUF2071 domain-containing protein [Bacteroidota bacterium]